VEWGMSKLLTSCIVGYLSKSQLDQINQGQLDRSFGRIS
ncbi:unnamed protein product, partial [Acidithrix sp. C25]